MMATRTGVASLLAIALLATACSSKSAAYERGFSDGRYCSDEGVPSSTCGTFCEIAATNDGLSGDEARDYIQGCKDGS